MVPHTRTDTHTHDHPLRFRRSTLVELLDDAHKESGAGGGGDGGIGTGLAGDAAAC